AVLPDLVVEVLSRATGLSQTFDLNEFSSAFTTPGATPTVPRQLQQVNSGAAAAVGLIAVALSLVQIGALTEAIGQRYLGRAITVGEAYLRGLRAVPRLIVAAIVVFFLFVFVFIVFAIALAVLAALNLAAIA